MESLESKKNNNGGVWRKLPPGFRFRPTDEELVVQYLWRKVLSFPLPSSIIPEIDLTDHDPKNLLSEWIEREKEGYFFKCKRSTNNGSSSSSNSSNEEKRSSGYWKAIGKEMPILSSRSNKLVGMKKILSFFRGRRRTKWIMHEFRLAGVAAGIKSCMFTQKESTFICQEKEWVVCRIFKKRKEKRIHARLMDHSTDSMIQVNKVSRISSSSSSSSSSLNLSCVTEVMEDSDNEDEFSSKSMDSSSYGNLQD